MGAVYEAEDQILGRRVALKMLSRELCSDGSALERFQREARAASALNHPNICTIYEISQWGDVHFIALELLEGQRLKDRIANRALQLNSVLSFGIQIAMPWTPRTGRASFARQLGQLYPAVHIHWGPRGGYSLGWLSPGCLGQPVRYYYHRWRWWGWDHVQAR
jgi:hypothetical protein